MKQALLISFLLMLRLSGWTQTTDSIYQPVKQLFGVATFATNPAGELFTVTTANELIKYDTNGDSTGTFNDVKRYGKLSYVDAQNPWKTLLFYENFQTIVLLDKYLKNLGSIKLPAMNVFDVKAVTTSYDNHIWVFDGRESRIKKLDDNGRILMLSVDLRQVFNDVPSPTRMIDMDGLLYLYDPQKGLYIFDYYGSFKMQLPFVGWRSLLVQHKEVIGFDATSAYRYRAPVPTTTATPLPAAFQHAEMMSADARYVYVLRNSILNIYRAK